MNYPMHSPETPEGQKKAIYANEKNITVGAGAGTGKTWVLSERYLRLLLDDRNILPGNILTLTYTEAAAGEMKQRIEARINDALENFDDEERKREIIDGLSDIWISTIHSFAARLIRESGLSLDIDPGASVISTYQEQEFWDNIRNAAEFANLSRLARAYGDKTLRSVSKFLDGDKYFSAAVAKWRSGNLSSFAQKTAELHASSGHTWLQMLEWSENDELVANTRPMVKKILLDEWREVWRIWEDKDVPRAKNPNGPGGKLNDILDYQSFNDPGNEEALQHFYKGIVLDKDIRANQYEPFATVKNFFGMTLGDWRKTRPKLIQDITQNFDEEFSEQELTMRKVLMKFCAVSWGMWDMMKKRRGLLSFSDMILHAVQAVKNESVSRKFEHILVDEFQDTDPLQFSMIEALAKNSEGAGLFAVGDPKQSIYKFRHADPSLFADTIKNADTRIELDVSFRTRASLLKRINKIFSELWHDGLGRSDSMAGLVFEPLKPMNNDGERNSGTMPDFKIILAGHDSNTRKEALKNLADEVAYYIALCVKEGRTVWDKEQKIIRPVKFSDFAVLSRSRSCFGILEEALNRFGIKSIQDKSNEYFSRGEVGDIVCMLRAAANCNDDFAVAGWLMSPFSGVSEDEAIKCLEIFSCEIQKRSNEKRKKLHEIIEANLPEANKTLEYLALVGEIEGPAGLLSIYDNKRQWLSCYKPDDRLRVLRNFRLALSMSRKFQQSGTSSLTACAEWLTGAVRSNTSLEEPEYHDKNENAVRLGAVHSAKGLEYPVTVIFEHRTRKNSDKDSLRPSKNLGLVFSDLPDEVTEGKEIKPRGVDWEKLLSEQGDSEEEERLFYVAATRAQDSLIFCGLVNEANGKPHNNTWTKLMLDNAKNIEPYFAFGIDDKKIPEVKINDESQNLMRNVNIIHAKNFLRQISATSFALFEWCPFAWRRNHMQGINLSWENPSRDDVNVLDDFTGGAELGSLAHWILSRWPKNDDYEAELDYLLNDKSVLSMLPGYLRDSWRHLRNDRAILKRYLMNFAASEIGEKLRKENNVRREFNFRLKLTESTLLAGAVDAVYCNNIIDYKITSVDNVPTGLYESQLDFYALVMHALGRFESVNTCIVFLREGESFMRECKNFDTIRERVINAAEICASGPYNPKYENCPLCPFKKGCVMNNEGRQ